MTIDEAIKHCEEVAEEKEREAEYRQETQGDMFKFLDEHLTNFFKGISLPSISAFPDSNYLINIRIFQYNDKYLKISL